MQHVNSAISRLEMYFLVGIILGHRFSEHIAEGYAETLCQRAERLTYFANDGGHKLGVYQTLPCPANPAPDNSSGSSVSGYQAYRKLLYRPQSLQLVKSTDCENIAVRLTLAVHRELDNLSGFGVEEWLYAFSCEASSAGCCIKPLRFHRYPVLVIQTKTAERTLSPLRCRAVENSSQRQFVGTREPQGGWDGRFGLRVRAPRGLYD
jgi:hypothetical protein